MTSAPDGTLFVGTTGDKVYRVAPDRKVSVVASGLHEPNGVAYRDGSLYIAEVARLSRLPNALKATSWKGAEILGKMPDKEHHGYRVLRFGPDGRLYVGIGAPLNVGESPEPFGTLSRFSSDFKSLEVYARGVRNTMGFDWNPADGNLWFTDNGRDMLGDDLPPEELNCAPKPGLHFGFPYRYGNNVPDPQWGDKAPPKLTFTPPAATMQAHVAPLGMRFYQGKQFPAEYKGRIFIANHGSWNRSTPAGYRVMMARVTGPGQAKIEPFAVGWLEGSRVTGRPVDVIELSDGSLAISDDFGGKIYRVWYSR